jgi:trimethylamine--corrinoid protein Co-methyltransferase
MEAGVSGSYAQIVCDNEIAGSVRRSLRGFLVDEDSLAVDVIDKVMNGSHNFLAEPHSIKYLRSGEIKFAKLSVRDTFTEWDRSGRRDLTENAQAEADRILAEHQVPPLEDVQEAELDLIMQAATRELVPG